jgi:glycosyltransferase involved in cell wall biosynthesis
MLYVGLLPPHPGGAPISCLQILAGLSRLGHTVRVFAPITAEAIRSGDLLADKYPRLNVTRYLVPYNATNPTIPIRDEYLRFENRLMHERLPQLIREDRPDIIILGRESFAWHVPDIAISYSLPSILMIRGGTTLGILNGHYPRSLADRFLEQFSKVNLIVPVANHFAMSLQELGFKNIRVILNSVDLNEFSPRQKNKTLLTKLGIRNNEVILAHVSHLKTVKRPLDIVNSAEIALKQNDSLVYMIVGDGPLRDEMEEFFKKKGIFKRFRFIGWVDYDRMPDYINLADAVIMTSEGEGLSRVFLETQACGRLLVASDIPAAMDVIIDGETGLLFRKGDIHDLTTKTLLAAGDPNLRSEIGLKARESVQVHNLDDAVVKYSETITEVIQKHRKM